MHLPNRFGRVTFAELGPDKIAIRLGKKMQGQENS